MFCQEQMIEADAKRSYAGYREFCVPDGGWLGRRAIGAQADQAVVTAFVVSVRNN